jgi:D-alanyl-D-alanine carboxypeptidase (penicillin-binding protein 5/6)
MNATAARLGADDTVAGTPSGLDVAGQSSSPYDLALVFRALMDDPLTAGVFQVRTADIPPVPARNMPGFQIQTQNPLLEDYPGDLGAKDGFTDAARHTFVTAAQRNGRRLVVTLMQDERQPVDTPEQAARLLDWGFAVPAGSAGVGRLVRPGEVPTSPPTSAAAGGAPVAARAGAPGGPGEPGTPVALAVLGGAGGLALAGGGWLAYRRTRRRSAAR